MMSELASQALPWMAAVMGLLALAAATAALAARSLFGMSMALAATNACMSGALAALGYGDGAMAVALFGVALAPVLLLPSALLSSRAVKPRRRGAPWLSLAAGALAGAAMLWTAPSLDRDGGAVAGDGEPGAALPALVFVAIAAAVALLGYGERGVFGGRGGRDG